MSKIFLIHDKTERNFRRPFVKICSSRSVAESVVAELQKKLDASSKSLISFSEHLVPDFDSNKSHIYVLFNKTDSAKSVIEGFFFDFYNAEAKLKETRKKYSSFASKLILLQHEQITK